MKRKHIWKIIGLLILMFFSLCGQAAEDMFRADMDYDAVFAYWLSVLLPYMLIICAVMMIVPFLARIAKKENLPYKSGKRLCLWNSIILLVISLVLQIYTDFLFIGGIGALIFYFINKWLFVSEPQPSNFSSTQCNPLSPTTSYVPSSTQTQSSSISLSPNDEISLVNKKSFDIYGSDIKLEQKTETPRAPMVSPASQHVSSYVPDTNSPSKYCSRCGHSIDPVSKKCTGCGRQYFKGFNAKTILIIILCILLSASIVGSILLYASNVKLREKADTLNTSNDTPQTAVTVPNTKNETSEQSPTTYVLKNGQIGVFVYTIDHEFTANYVYARCESSIIDAKNLGIDPEMIIYDIMDENGGEYHIIEAGDFVDEIDSWCFSSERKVGDLAMIENPYGYSVCYISCIGER